MSGNFILKVEISSNCLKGIDDSMLGLSIKYMHKLCKMHKKVNR